MKYKPRYPIPVAEINSENHIFSGVVWNVTGSKGDTYHIEMSDKGFTCECLGFQARGVICKHIKDIVNRLTIDPLEKEPNDYI